MKKYFLEFTDNNLENEYLKLVGKSNDNENYVYSTNHLDDDDILFINRIIKIKKIKNSNFNYELFLLEYNNNRIKYLDYLNENNIKIKNLIFKKSRVQYFFKNEKIINKNKYV